MHRDQHGLDMTAASEAAVRHYDETLFHFMGLRQDTGDRLAEAFEADPDMPMAHCARADSARWIDVARRARRMTSAPMVADGSGMPSTPIRSPDRSALRMSC